MTKFGQLSLKSYLLQLESTERLKTEPIFNSKFYRPIIERVCVCVCVCVTVQKSLLNRGSDIPKCLVRPSCIS